MSVWVEVTTAYQLEAGEERWVRLIDNSCWISVLHRMTGFGYMEWETALVFCVPPEQRPAGKDCETLIIRGDWREELEGMPKEQLRDWYAAHIEGNRNSMDSILHALKQEVAK